MKLRTLSSEMRRSLAGAWGQQLEDQGHQLQAALLYHQAKNQSKESSLFFSRSRWKLGRASQVNLDNASAMKHVTNLENNSKSQDAALMAWEVTKDAEEAVRLMAFSGMWEDAFMVSQVSKRPDLIETELKPAVIQAAQSFVTEMSAIEQRWHERSDRIIHLRDQQRNKISQNFRNDYNEQVNREYEFTSFIDLNLGRNL